MALFGAQVSFGSAYDSARTWSVDPEVLSVPRLPPRERGVVRPEPRRKAGGVQHLGVELVDLHPEGSGLVIPVERHVAVQLLEAGRPRVDRLGRTRGLALAGAASLGENSGCGDQAQGYRKE